MSINIKKNSGFTLMETVIALGIGIITTAMIVLIFTAGLKSIRTIKDTQVLNSNAVFFLDRVTYLIKQGKSFDTSDSNKLIIDKDTLNEILIDKSFFAINTISSATTTFKRFQKSVQLNFIIQKGSEIFSATTTIAQRSF